MFTKKEVRSILKETGRRTKTDGFDIFLAPKIQEEARILIITSSKIANAPKRNQLRRRLKSIFYENNLFKSPYDCIVIAKRKSISLSFEELRKILTSIFIKENEETNQ